MNVIGSLRRREANQKGWRPLGLWAFFLSIAALAGTLILQHDRTALGVAAVGLIMSIMFLDGGRSNLLGNCGWIPWAWVALALVPDFRFTYRDPLDTSVSTASLENFVQVLVYMLVAGLVLWSRRLLVTQDPRHIRKGPILFWPLIALASTLWSLVPLFTFVRALQLLVPIGLAIVMVRLWLSSPALAATIWRNTLRLFVQAVTILVLFGFAAGFWRDPRFSWPGTHPGVASMYMGVAILLLIACGRPFLGFRMTGYVFRLLLFGAGFYMGETRAVIAALLVAIAVLLWWAGRTKPLARYLGLLYYSVALGLVVIAARPEIMQYLLRGGTTQTITSLNGRIPLWGASLDLLGDADRWVTGFGYGAARVILPTLAEWAGTAHNSWVELLLAVGVLGPLLTAADILFLLLLASSRRAIIPPVLTLSLLTFLVIVSTTGEVLAFPGLGFVMIALLHVPVLTKWNWSSPRTDMRAESGKRDDVESRAPIRTAFVERR